MGDAFIGTHSALLHYDRSWFNYRAFTRVHTYNIIRTYTLYFSDS